MIIQGQLDSADSHQFCLTPAGKLQAKLNPNTHSTIKRVVAHLRKYRQTLGMTPVPAMMHLSKLTKSFHYGASFPMKKNPCPLETDLLGRPVGLQRVHLIDSSIFPTIPAGSITPTMMANTYRIASECPIYEPS